MQRLRSLLRGDQMATQKPKSHRPVCTHVCASRVFNEDLLCSHCGQPGNMGWVYRCTEDSDGRVPIDESGLEESEVLRLKEYASQNGWRLPGVDPAFSVIMFRTENHNGDISVLKLWMRKAAASGEYTPLQIEKLIAQRMQVRQQIRATEMTVTSSEDSLSDSQLKKKEESMIKAKEQVDMHTIEFNRQEIEAPNSMAETNTTGDGKDLLSENHSKATLCDYTCCPACRPVMRERAWVAIDSVICPEDLDLFPDDVDLRPLAAANIILRIGSRSNNTISTCSTGSLDPGNSEEFNVVGPMEVVYRRRSATFLDNIRRAYENYLAKPIARTRSANLRTSSESRKSSHSEEMDIVDADEDERTAALSVERPESRMGDAWMGESIGIGQLSSLSPELLQHMRQDSIADILASAANHSTLSIQQSQDHSELHVGAGVAVTEEAVKLGMADVITQS